MSSDDIRDRLEDIVENADRIGAYLADLDERAFRDDGRTVDAAERCLERIAEPVVRIGADHMAKIAPDLPFERVRGLGNVLRHAYDKVDLHALYLLTQDGVPALREASARAMAG